MHSDSVKKIFILLPDGVGLRTFAYTKLSEIAKAASCPIVFWNNTPMPLGEMGLESIAFESSATNPFTALYKNARKHIELNLFSRKFNDQVYNAYRFPLKSTSLKSRFRIAFTNYLIARFDSESGLIQIRKRINSLERKTAMYTNAVECLKKNRPALLFCSNQRHSSAIAPILAAQDLGIPTATFIFSWDNLPKATMVLECDYYFVWSDLMKKQLQEYYPYIKEMQIRVCGTAQFEAHYLKDQVLPREDFFAMYGLDPDTDYVCYSGDDITTSPDDALYLRDVALAIRDLNDRGYKFGILFRRCPVDFGCRYDTVLAEYSDIIRALNPKWESKGETWQSVVPLPEDSILLSNTAEHTFGTINFGSSMVFDFAAHQKPCAYINYNQPDRADKSWDVAKIYQYVHFRSMPSKEAVIWLNSPSDISYGIIKMLENPEPTVRQATEWFEKITMMPVDSASERIFKAMQQIMSRA